MSKLLTVKIKNLPDTPGIYLFYNSQKELIYVGKATSLKSRVRSYFIVQNIGKLPLPPLGKRGTRPIEAMIHEVADIKTIETDSVLEAIILEANTIKKFQPKYNVDLKDDKSWNYIVITKDNYPKIELIREHELKSQKSIKLKIHKVKNVFGPYPGLKTKEMLKLLRKLFFVSTCNPPKQVNGKKDPSSASRRTRNEPVPCFYYQLGQCLGVCTGEISPADYKKKVIKPLVQFLSGKKKSLLKNLEKEMKLASKNHEFEEAGRLRDQIRNLQKIQDIALLNKTFVESPRLKTYDLGLKTVRIEGYDISNLGASGMVGSMVVFDQHGPVKSEYRKFKIKTVKGQSDVDCLAEILERRLTHVSPSYQEGESLLEQAGGVADAADETPANSSAPMRIGAPPLGKRRIYWPLPQIILVDGGVPQVHKVLEVIKSKSLLVPVVGIAKGPERKRNDFVIANITNDKENITNKNFIKWVNENKKLLISVRDEAHRFAIKYQRSLRKIL